MIVSLIEFKVGSTDNELMEVENVCYRNT